MLLPICVVAALFLVWQGVPQTFGAYVDVRRRWKARNQVLARGPVAIAEGDQALSGDGGGFFNANSAHPFENPTPLTGLAGDAADLADRRGADQHVRPHGRRPAAGLGSARRHGGAVRVGLAVVYQRGTAATRCSHRSVSTRRQAHLQAGGNMEGKEVRFGIGRIGAVRRQ